MAFTAQGESLMYRAVLDTAAGLSLASTVVGYLNPPNSLYHTVLGLSSDLSWDNSAGKSEIHGPCVAPSPVLPPPAMGSK